MFRAETLDHVAFPVRDLPRSEKFYFETVGLTFLDPAQKRRRLAAPHLCQGRRKHRRPDLAGRRRAGISQRRAALRHLACRMRRAFDCRGRDEFVPAA